jgi:hypothetical protein
MSPDGTRIVFEEAERTKPRAKLTRLVVYDLVKKERRTLGDGPRDEHPTWSPKGDWIAFTHNCYERFEGNRRITEPPPAVAGRNPAYYVDRRIWLVKPDGSEQKPVVDENGKPIFGWWPSWSPDGMRVGITRDLLYVADLQSHKVEYIDPSAILGERVPWTFMGHHWGKRGWLLNRGGIIIIDDTTKKARLLVGTGIYNGSERWGVTPVELKGKSP